MLRDGYVRTCGVPRDRFSVRDDLVIASMQAVDGVAGIQSPEDLLKRCLKIRGCGLSERLGQQLLRSRTYPVGVAPAIMASPERDIAPTNYRVSDIWAMFKPKRKGITCDRRDPEHELIWGYHCEIKLSLS